MSTADLDRSIHDLSRKRQRLWSEGGDPVAVRRLSDDLEALYEERRRERARMLHGERRAIMRQARLEYELEKLMEQV